MRINCPNCDIEFTKVGKKQEWCSRMCSVNYQKEQKELQYLNSKNNERTTGTDYNEAITS